MSVCAADVDIPAADATPVASRNRLQPDDGRDRALHTTTQAKRLRAGEPEPEPVPITSSAPQKCDAGTAVTPGLKRNARQRDAGTAVTPGLRRARPQQSLWHDQIKPARQTQPRMQPGKAEAVPSAAFQLTPPPVASMHDAPAAATTWCACASCCIARAHRRPRAAARRAGRKSDRTNYGSDGCFRGWPLGSSIRANSGNECAPLRKWTPALAAARRQTAGVPDEDVVCGRLWVRRSFLAEPSRAHLTHQCSSGQETGATCRTLAPHESGCAGRCPRCRPSA